MLKPFHKLLSFGALAGLIIGTCSSCGTIKTDSERGHYISPAFLAPASKGFSENSEIMKAAKLKKQMAGLRKELEQWIEETKPLSVDSCMEKLRKIFQLRDDWLAAQAWLSLEDVSPEMRDILGKKISRVAAAVIKRKILVSFKELVKDWSIEQLTATRPQRLSLLDAYLFSPGFAQKYLDLSRGPRTIVDFGVGERPVTTVELAKKAEQVNGGINVIGVDEYYPAVIVNVDDDVAHFDEKGDLIHVNGVLARDLPRDRVRNYQVIKYVLEKESGGKDYRASDGRNIWFAGADKKYGQRNLRFVKGGFAFPIDQQVDLIRAMNVFIYYEPIVIAGALLEFEKRLKENGVLVVGGQQINTDFGQWHIYQKRNGRLVPVEMLMTGISDLNLRRALQIQNSTGAELVYDPLDNASFCSSLLDKKFFKPEIVAEFYDGGRRFFDDVMTSYLGAKKDMRTVAAYLVKRYQDAGFLVAYDGINGFLQFRFNEQGVLNGNRDLLIARRILERAGIPDILNYTSAPKAFLPFLNLRMRVHNLTDLPAYAKYLAQSAEETVELKNAVAQALRIDEGVFTLTTFFRGYYAWEESSMNYVHALVRMKVRNGDYAICVKSIGSSIGQEAYSAGIIVYQALLEYAETDLYGDVQSADERRRLAERWVDKWQVRLEAYDMNIRVLEKAAEGVYDEHEPSMLYNYVVENFPSFIRRVGGTLVVDERVRKWLVPIYINLNESELLPLISETRGDIVMCNNVLGYLKGNSAMRLIDVVKKELPSTRYPTFYVTDLSFKRISRGWVHIPEDILVRELTQHDYKVSETASALGVAPVELLLAETDMLIKKMKDKTGDMWATIGRLDVVRGLLKMELRRIDDGLAAIPSLQSAARLPEAVKTHAVLEAIGTDVERMVMFLDDFLPMEYTGSKSYQYDTLKATGDAA